MQAAIDCKSHEMMKKIILSHSSESNKYGILKTYVNLLSYVSIWLF